MGILRSGLTLPPKDAESGKIKYESLSEISK